MQGIAAAVTAWQKTPRSDRSGRVEGELKRPASSSESDESDPKDAVEAVDLVEPACCHAVP